MTKERQIRIMGVDILNSYIELERSRRCASNCPECLAEELYTAGYRKQAWISVDDALPDDLQKVLIYDGNAIQWEPRVAVAKFVRGRTAEQRMRDGDGSIRGGDEYGNNLKPYEWKSVDGTLRWFGQYVTHWMPLPEPPRMKGEKE